MSSRPFDHPHLDDAWRAYAEMDRQLAPDPALEARVFARLRGPRPAADARRILWQPKEAMSRRPRAIAIAASIAAAVFLAWPRTELSVAAPLEARAVGLAGLAVTVAADRPGRGASAPVHRDAAALDAYVQHVELPVALMQFGTAPPTADEPLQMVRLRLPIEALQALGLAVFELDASGVVDVDVVIGEDGLPRDIRQVRIGQEQR